MFTLTQPLKIMRIFPQVYQSDSYEISTCGKDTRYRKHEIFSENFSKERGLDEDEAENNDGMLFICPDHSPSSKINKSIKIACNRTYKITSFFISRSQAVWCLLFFHFLDHNYQLVSFSLFIFNAKIVYVHFYS